jgi:hypothetical protein
MSSEVFRFTINTKTTKKNCKVPSKVHSSQICCQIDQWVQIRIFSNILSIGFYVEFAQWWQPLWMSETQKIKILYATIQWLFIYSLGIIKFIVPENFIFPFSHRVLCKNYAMRWSHFGFPIGAKKYIYFVNDQGIFQQSLQLNGYSGFRQE